MLRGASRSRTGRSMQKEEVRMLSHELMPEEGILVVTPHGPLKSADFDGLAAVVDPYIEERGKLKGLMIYVEHFPGWDSFAALVTHMRFVKDHHQKIERVAAVTDSGFLSVLPRIADHFVDADIKHFDYKDKEAALNWLKQGDG